MSHVFSEDAAQTYSTDQRLASESSSAFSRNQKLIVSQRRCNAFLKEWRQNETFIYRERVKANYRSKTFDLEIDFSDFAAFDKSLSDDLAEHPDDILPLFESAALDVVAETLIPRPQKSDMHPIHVKIKNYPRLEAIRTLRSNHISRMITLTGIITSCYKVQSKAERLTIKCSTCNDSRVLECPKGFGTASFPRVCTSRSSGSRENSCELDPFVILPDSSNFVDSQKMRLQELPEDVPTGEIPCHLSMSSDRTLANIVTAGSRVKVVGVYCIYQPKVSNSSKENFSNIRIPYLRILGIKPNSESLSISRGPFTVSEEEEMRALSRDPNLFEKLAQSLAPKIFGHENVKKAIVCLLFGGTRKVFPSRSRIRGDINILLLGDPSVAKSQMLKCTEKTAPIAVYTSGKGSSAAGLTASVIQDPSGEFHLEGGAMVLADGGCVCIDEFDKMREEDRVAIHEAMEQQTISIAKAGITTVLNSRTSVLAAANPTFGRYDDMRKAAENIDFETTILSRFDLIFIIRDKKSRTEDEKIATHVLDMHMQKESDDTPPAIDPKLFSRYISYCRKHCRPRLSEEASIMLKNRYVAFRADAKHKQVKKIEN